MLLSRFDVKVIIFYYGQDHCITKLSPSARIAMKIEKNT